MANKQMRLTDAEIELIELLRNDFSLNLEIVLAVKSRMEDHLARRELYQRKERLVEYVEQIDTKINHLAKVESLLRTITNW
jgi:hypothetical protein